MALQHDKTFRWLAEALSSGGNPSRDPLSNIMVTEHLMMATDKAILLFAKNTLGLEPGYYDYYGQFSGKRSIKIDRMKPLPQERGIELSFSGYKVRSRVDSKLLAIYHQEKSAKEVALDKKYHDMLDGIGSTFSASDSPDFLSHSSVCTHTLGEIEGGDFERAAVVMPIKRP